MENIEVVKNISKKLVSLQVKYGLTGSCVMIHLLLHSYLKTRYNINTTIINGFCHFNDENYNILTTHLWLKYKDRIINITLNKTNSNRLFLMGEELYSPPFKIFSLIETEEDMKRYNPDYQFTKLHNQIKGIIESEENIKEYLINSPDRLYEKLIAHLEYGNIEYIPYKELPKKIRDVYLSFDK